MDHIGSESGAQGAGNDPAAVLVEHYRCPPQFASFRVNGELSNDRGFFRFASAVCYGRTASIPRASDPGECLFHAEPVTDLSTNQVGLPFNPTDVIENLRCERYLAGKRSERLLRSLYYSLRPVLSPPLRKLIQRSVTRGRRDCPFPAWPVDCSVEQIFNSLLQAAIQANGGSEIPFVWFWPEGHDAALMMTHDVEDKLGRDHCGMVMDLDDSFGIKAAFQVIPEGRYKGVEVLVGEIRARGFEANVHDLNHDGRLYDHRERFEKRAAKINEHAQRYGMRGFRAGSMYRNQQWFPLLDFEYEMSVPNVAHLEPQKGGCCTVMPYFVGGLLELPLTTVQDHCLFYILRERSIDLWKQQIAIIQAHHGLISFIIHPDYLVGSRERDAYRELLTYVVGLARDRGVWLALPGEINRWWRMRRGMRLVRQGQGWHIEGEGSERARVAYAQIVDGSLRYRIVPQPATPQPVLSPGARARGSGK